MAEFASPFLPKPPTRQQTIFDSVFPAGLIRPPSNYQRFQKDTAEIARECEDTLRAASRKTLGIGDEEFVFGGEGSFATYYAGSFSVSELPTNRVDLWEAEINKWDSSQLEQWTQKLGGDRVRKIFAKVLEACVGEFVDWSYSAFRQKEITIISHLRFWVRNIFASYVRTFLGYVRRAEAREDAEPEIVEKDVKRWEDIAITRLGALRVSELFEIVVDWADMKSCIDDLRYYTTNPATRTYVTSSFINALQTRLLHPGASTVEILQLYISIIRAFRRLDPKGVLLDRIARVIRRSLRDRDDTIKVIVSGLLSDTADENGEPLPPDPETLTELALELNKHDEDSKTNDTDLDWDNMDWQPDPIDAAPDYMKSKNTDVIGSLISLFDSKEVFVKELQSALADRLLKKKADYDQEVSVLEHLKLRFGSSSLQACEVMLRDVLDSRKVDNVIRTDQGMVETTAGTKPQFHSKILSRLFWPSLQEQEYIVPFPILEQQTLYEKGFESLKQSRKLTWVNALGHVEVELDLQDRIFRDDVLPWQAAVIYAFQSLDDEPARRTVKSIADELHMSPTLARSACIFWLSKRILTQSPTDPEQFTVLETLPSGSPQDSASAQPQVAAAAAAAEIAAQQAAKEADDQERKGKMAMYGQFVVSMLTNQGSMPLPRIAMMLGIVVPNGFPFGNEELKEFLTQMVKEGRLEVGHGGVYKAV